MGYKLEDDGNTIEALCPRCGGGKGIMTTSPYGFCRCKQWRRWATGELYDLDPDERIHFGVEGDETFERARAALANLAEGQRSKGVIMFGLPGRGKTHLMVAATRVALEHGEAAGYFNVSSLISQIQDTYGYEDSAESRESIIAGVADCDPVVLDDLGKERSSTDVASILYELIDRLYRKKRRLVVASNTPGDQFVERYDEAIRSRIAGMCEMFVLKGEDRRRESWQW